MAVGSKSIGGINVPSYEKSKAAFEQAKPLMPGGVNSL